MSDDNEKQQIINTYNKSSKYFINLFKKHGINTKEINLAFSKSSKKNPKTLELGCGIGKDAKYILKYTNDYLGIDFTEKLVKIAKAKTPDANFVVADFDHFEFPKNIDVVFAFASLLHSDKERLSRTILKIYKNMNIGGVFFIALANGKYEKKIFTIKGVGTRTFYFYTPKDIEKLLPDGLKIIYKKIKTVRGNKWFDLILKKIH